MNALVDMQWDDSGLSDAGKRFVEENDLETLFFAVCDGDYDGRPADVDYVEQSPAYLTWLYIELK